VARSRRLTSELWLVPANGGATAQMEFPAISIRELQITSDRKTIPIHTSEQEKS
jgi:hypothetical protein